MSSIIYISKKKIHKFFHKFIWMCLGMLNTQRFTKIYVVCVNIYQMLLTLVMFQNHWPSMTTFLSSERLINLIMKTIWKLCFDSFILYIYQLMFLEVSVTWVMWNLRKMIKQLSHYNCDMQFTIMMHIKWNILHINKAYNPWISSANVLP